MKIPTLIATGSAALAVTLLLSGTTAGEFDLDSLNRQVQNHEQRITTMEQSQGITPAPIPEATTNQAAAIKTAQAAPTQPTLATDEPAPAVTPAESTPTPQVTPTPTPQSGEWTNKGGWTTN